MGAGGRPDLAVESDEKGEIKDDGKVAVNEVPPL
jgi:hypothetical protein